MSLQKLSALERADVPSQPKDQDADAVPCVLLKPGALSPTAHEAGRASGPPPSGPTREVEDESADPVGDGHSDADLASKMDNGKTPTEPQPSPDRPAPDAEKGR